MNITSSLQRSTLGQSLTTMSQSFSKSLASWSPVILGASVTALVGLTAYRWRQHQNAPAMRVIDQSFEDIKNRVKQAYSYVLGGFALTAAAAVASHVTGLSLKIFKSHYVAPIGLFVISMGAVIKTICTAKEDVKTKHIAWAIFNISMGMMLSPLCFLSKSLLAQAAGITLGLGGLLTFVAFKAPDERFLKWEGPLMAALTTLSVASFISAFFPRTAFAYGVDRASLYGGLVIFSGLLMSSTQRLYEEAKTQIEKFDPINSSLNVYLDVLNIFVRVLRILAENKKEELAKS